MSGIAIQKLLKLCKSKLPKWIMVSPSKSAQLKLLKWLKGSARWRLSLSNMLSLQIPDQSLRTLHLKLRSPITALMGNQSARALSVENAAITA